LRSGPAGAWALSSTAQTAGLPKPKAAVNPTAANLILVLPNFDLGTQAMHDLCMATKTISIEIDAYDLLVRERKDPKESFSRVIRRVLSERPALTAGDLLDAMKAFEGRGAGPRRRRSRDAAA
jgi:predicted CopG family antitoxin